MASASVGKLKKKAAEFEQKKQFDKALSLYVQVLEELGRDLDDSDLQLFNRVGDLLMRQANVSEALSYYEKAVDVYAERGFLNNAIALCNKILRQSPARTAVYYKLGKISASKGFKSDAKKNFLEYADRMQKGGKVDEAFRALKEFADLCPDQDDIRLMLADQLQKDDRKGEALEQLETLYRKFEAEGRESEARATIDRMKLIDPAVVPPETGAWVAQKSNDLIFLDLAAEDSPAERRREREVEEAHTAPSSAPANAQVVPALEGLTLTFIPDEDAAVGSGLGAPLEGFESTSAEGRGESAFDGEMSRLTDMIADESATVGDTVNVDSLVIVGTELWNSDDDAVPKLVGLESPRVTLSGAHPSLAPLIDEPPMTGSEFGSLDLTPVAGGSPRRTHDLALPSDLPLLPTADEPIDLLRVLATPADSDAIPFGPGDSDVINLLDLPPVGETGEAAITNALSVTGSASPLESEALEQWRNDMGAESPEASPKWRANPDAISDDETSDSPISDLEASQDTHSDDGVRGDLAPSDLVSGEQEGPGSEDGRRETRDTTELIALGEGSRVTDEILIVSAEPIDEASDRAAREGLTLHGEETPDAWIEAALGSRDDFSMDRLLTPLSICAIDPSPGVSAESERPDASALGAAEDAQASPDTEHDATPTWFPAEPGEERLSLSGDYRLIELADLAGSFAHQREPLAFDGPPPDDDSPKELATADLATSDPTAADLTTSDVTDAEGSTLDRSTAPIAELSGDAPLSSDTWQVEDSRDREPLSPDNESQHVDDAGPISSPEVDSSEKAFTLPEFELSELVASATGDNVLDVDSLRLAVESRSATGLTPTIGSLIVDPPEHVASDGGSTDLPLLDVDDLVAPTHAGELSISSFDVPRDSDPSYGVEPPDFGPSDDAAIYSADEPSVHAPSVHAPSVDEPSVDEPSVDEPSVDALTPDEWPSDVSPEVLIDGEWRDEHVGGLVSGEVSAIRTPGHDGNSHGPQRFDDLAAAMMWSPSDQIDADAAPRRYSTPVGIDGIVSESHLHSGSVSFGGVEAQIRRRLELDPDNLILRRQLGEALLDKGARELGLHELDITMRGFEQLGDLDGARTVADVVLRVIPSSVYHHQKRVEYAVRSNDRPRLVEAYVELADSLFRSGEQEKAGVVYSRVLELSPTNERAQFAMALMVSGTSAEPETTGARAPAEFMVSLFDRSPAGEQVSISSEMPAIDNELRIEGQSPSGPPVTANLPEKRSDSSAGDSDDPGNGTDGDGIAPNDDEPRDSEHSRTEAARLAGESATVVLEDDQGQFGTRGGSEAGSERVGYGIDSIAVEAEADSGESDSESSVEESDAAEDVSRRFPDPGLDAEIDAAFAEPPVVEPLASPGSPETESAFDDGGGPLQGAAALVTPVSVPVSSFGPSVSRPTPASVSTAGRDDDFVDLGSWLRANDVPRSTRMVTSDVAPSGDEQADFNEMLRRFKQGVSENVDEEDYASHYDLGVAFKEMGLIDEAISEFQKALRGDSHRVQSYEALGQCFVEKGQLQVAVTLLRRALETTRADDQQLVGVLYLLGYASEVLARHADALGYYQRVFAVDIEFRDVAQRVAVMEPQIQ